MKGEAMSTPDLTNVPDEVDPDDESWALEPGVGGDDAEADE